MNFFGNVRSSLLRCYSLSSRRFVLKGVSDKFKKFINVNYVLSLISRHSILAGLTAQTKYDRVQYIGAVKCRLSIALNEMMDITIQTKALGKKPSL